MPLSHLPPDVVAFAESMPPAYRQAFSPRAIQEHAAIASARGSKQVHAALWRTFSRGLAVICVVAHDHPGLLGVVSAAFVLHRLDITTAQIHCRTLPGGELEAVDLFWVRRHDFGKAQRKPPSEDEVNRCVDTVVGFVRAHVVPETLLPRLETAPRADFEPRVHFEVNRAGEYELVVEAPDGTGLLMHLARTLYRQRLTILSSEIRTDGDTAHDRFVIAPEHTSRLDSAQRERICAEITQTLQGWRDARSSPESLAR